MLPGTAAPTGGLKALVPPAAAGSTMGTHSSTASHSHSHSPSHLLHKLAHHHDHHHSPDPVLHSKPVLQTAVGGAVGQAGGAAVPAAAVAASPAGPAEGAVLVGGPVPGGLKEFVAHNTTHAPMRVTVRPTHPVQE